MIDDGMTRAGQMIENPVSGERIIYGKTSHDTGDELIQFDYFLRPHGVGFGATPHYHLRQEEWLKIVSGRLQYILGSKKASIGPGEEIVLRPKIPHAHGVNSSDEELHVKWESRNGQAQAAERFAQTWFGLARDGKSNKVGTPKLLQLAVMIQGNRDRIRPSSRYVAALVPILAPIGKLSGHKAWYPEYSD